MKIVINTLICLSINEFIYTHIYKKVVSYLVHRTIHIFIVCIVYIRYISHTCGGTIHMIHALITAAYCCICLLCNITTYVVILPASFYIGRELAQSEYRYIEYYCNRKRENMPWYAPFTLKAWSKKDGSIYWKSILDWLLPCIVTIIAIVIDIYVL